MAQSASPPNILKRNLSIRETNVNQRNTDESGHSFTILQCKSIRNLRAEYDIAPSKGLDVMLKVADKKDAERLKANEIVLSSLAKLDSIKVLKENQETPACATALVGKSELMIPMAGLINKDAKLARLDKEVARIQGEIKRTEGKLSNCKSP